MRQPGSCASGSRLLPSLHAGSARRQVLVVSPVQHQITRRARGRDPIDTPPLDTPGRQRAVRWPADPLPSAPCVVGLVDGTAAPRSRGRHRLAAAAVPCSGAGRSHSAAEAPRQFELQLRHLRSASPRSASPAGWGDEAAARDSAGGRGVPGRVPARCRAMRQHRTRRTRGRAAKGLDGGCCLRSLEQRPSLPWIRAHRAVPPSVPSNVPGDETRHEGDLAGNMSSRHGEGSGHRVKRDVSLCPGQRGERWIEACPHRRRPATQPPDAPWPRAAGCAGQGGPPQSDDIRSRRRQADAERATPHRICLADPGLDLPDARRDQEAPDISSRLSVNRQDTAGSSERVGGA